MSETEQLIFLYKARISLRLVSILCISVFVWKNGFQQKQNACGFFMLKKNKWNN